MKSPRETRPSATRVQAFDACPRKWGWANLAGFDVPSASQQLGTRVHGAIERYLKTRTPLDLSSEAGEIALAGYHLWPSEPVGVELDWEALIGGERFVGAIDIVSVDPDETPVVWDHKTTKSFGWALTPETLAENTQACVYAQAIMQLTSTPKCRLRWIYYKTTKPYRAVLVETEVTEASIAPVIERAAETAKKIRSLPQYVHPLDLPPNPLECDAYGGCGHRERCNLSGSDKVLALMTQSNERHQAMSQAPTFLQTLQGQAAAANGTAPAPTPQASPTPQWTPPVQPGAAPAMPPLPPGQQWVQDPGTGQYYPVSIQSTPAAPVAPASAPAFNPPSPPVAPVTAASPDAPKRGRKPKAEGRAAFVAAATAFAGALYDAFADGE